MIGASVQRNTRPASEEVGGPLSKEINEIFRKKRKITVMTHRIAESENWNTAGGQVLTLSSTDGGQQTPAMSGPLAVPVKSARIHGYVTITPRL